MMQLRVLDGGQLERIHRASIEILETIIRELKENNVAFHMSDVKGPVTDRLKAAGFDREFLEEHIFLSTHEAMSALSTTREYCC